MANPIRTAWFPVIEGRLPTISPVHELVYDDDVSRVDLTLQGATGRGGQDVGAPLLAEGLDVGSVVDLGGHQVVLASMSGRRGERKGGRVGRVEWGWGGEVEWDVRSGEEKCGD